jgi:hypothetical protein
MQLPIVVVVLVALIAVYVVAFATTRRFIRTRRRGGHNEVLVPLFLTAGTLYAVLLAFVVIDAWASYEAAKHNAAEEASTLATMYRQTAGMPDSERGTMRPIIRNYTEAVIKDEWPVQAASGGASPKARSYVVAFYRTFGQLKPDVAKSPISLEFLHAFSIVIADRNRRTLQANEELPGVLWAGLIVGAVIVVVMSFVPYMESGWAHFLMSGLMTLLILTLLGITLLFNQPFKEPLAIGPASFQHSLDVYDSVDRT